MVERSRASYLIDILDDMLKVEGSHSGAAVYFYKLIACLKKRYCPSKNDFLRATA